MSCDTSISVALIPNMHIYPKLGICDEWTKAKKTFVHNGVVYQLIEAISNSGWSLTNKLVKQKNFEKFNFPYKM